MSEHEIWYIDCEGRAPEHGKEEAGKEAFLGVRLGAEKRVQQDEDCCHQQGDQEEGGCRDGARKWRLRRCEELQDIGSVCLGEGREGGTYLCYFVRFEVQGLEY